MKIIPSVFTVMFFALVLGTLAHAEIRVHEHVVETTTRATPVPGYETATFIVTRCVDGCAGNRVRLTPATRYYLGTRESSLKELREAAALAPHRIVVFFTADGTVTRIQVSSLSS